MGNDGYEEVVKLLVAEGADVNAQGGFFGNEEAVKMLVEDDARLGPGLVFDDELQAQLSRGSRHLTQFRGIESLAEKNPRQPAISGKRRSGRSRVSLKGPSGCGSRMGQERKGAQEVERIKGTKLPVSSFIRSLISHPHLQSLYLSRNFPTMPRQYIFVLDSGSRAKYVRR